jgi:hypothetical protein
MATHCSLITANNAINATLYDKLNFNVIRDIAPVASVSRTARRGYGPAGKCNQAQCGVERARGAGSGAQTWA